MLAKNFPLFINLMLAGSSLEYNELLWIESQGSTTMVHVRKHCVAGRVEKFGHGTDVQVDSTII